MSNRAAAWISMAILALAIAIAGADKLRAPVDRCLGPGRFSVSSGDVPILLDTCSGNAWETFPDSHALGQRWRAMTFGVAKADASRSVSDFSPEASMMTVTRRRKSPDLPGSMLDLAPSAPPATGFEDLAPAPSSAKPGDPNP